MSKCLHGRAIAIVAAVVFGASTLPARAQDFFEAARTFRLDNACTATRGIRGGADPIEVAAGQELPARGVNRKVEPSHVFVRIGEQNRWLPIGCGTFTDGGGVPGQKPAGPDRAQACLPFFDNDSATVRVGVGGDVDVTPKAPVLSAFDKALNATCGAPGTVVQRDAFKAMMRAHPDVLARVMTFTGGKVFADRPARTGAPDAFLDDLAEAWFAVHAFDHIFCGEPSASGPGKIGGLHFTGRYLDLQEKGAACRMPNYPQNEVKPGVIYTMGVMMKNASGNFVRDARKGYGLTLTGEELLALVTRAFAENPTTGDDTKGCLLAVKDDGHAFSAVFARRAQGIRTFYPDATPNGRGDRINPKCSAEISLQ